MDIGTVAVWVGIALVAVVALGVVDIQAVNPAQPETYAVTDVKVERNTFNPWVLVLGDVSVSLEERSVPWFSVEQPLYFVDAEGVLKAELTDASDGSTIDTAQVDVSKKFLEGGEDRKEMVLGPIPDTVDKVEVKVELWNEDMSEVWDEETVTRQVS